MAQSTLLQLANVAGAAFRSALNTLLTAMQTLNSGTTPPTATVPNMMWMDTSVNPPVLRIRNDANTAWVMYDMRAAGLGVESLPVVTSMDTHTTAGWGRTASAAVGNPLTTGSFRFQHLVGSSTTAASQIAIHETNGRVFTRLRAGGSWGAWQEFVLGGISVSSFAASAIRLLTEGFATPADTELATAAWVDGAIVNRIANLAYGAIGSLAYCMTDGPITEGTTYAGSALFPAGVYGASFPAADTGTSVGLTRGGTALSGTWRALGRSSISPGSTLFMRIS